MFNIDDSQALNAYASYFYYQLIFMFFILAIGNLIIVSAKWFVYFKFSVKLIDCNTHSILMMAKFSKLILPIFITNLY